MQSSPSYPEVQENAEIEKLFMLELTTNGNQCYQILLSFLILKQISNEWMRHNLFLRIKNRQIKSFMSNFVQCPFCMKEERQRLRKKIYLGCYRFSYDGTVSNNGTCGKNHPSKALHVYVQKKALKKSPLDLLSNRKWNQHIKNCLPRATQ